MKKITLIIFQLLICFAVSAQLHETVNTIELSAPSSKSYIVNQSGTLKTGFTHSAVSQGTFFLRANPEPEQGPVSGANYVRTDVLQTPITSESSIAALTNSQKTTSYTYFDGAQRQTQSIILGLTPAGKDVISYIKYDAFGRVAETRLPYSIGQNSAVPRSNLDTDQAAFYNGTPGVAIDSEPYSYVKFDDSPLNRVTRSYGSGVSWHETTGNNKYNKTITRSNATSEVRLWSYDGTTTPSTVSSYPAGALQVQEATDEQGKITMTFSDFRNQVILIKTGSGSDWTETYSIYNYSGDLCFIFSPEASSRITSEYNQVGTNKQDFIDRWCFQFKYDAKGRLTDKRFPGADWVYLVYDRWDRQVFTQDGNLRLSSKWIFTKYDELNRPIITGTITGSRSTMETAANGATVRGETRQNNSVGYSNSTVPSASQSDMLTIAYYDDYNFRTYTLWDEDGKDYSFFNETGFPQSTDVALGIGFSTGSKVRVLGTSDWLNSINYYDKYGRIIQATTENYMGGKDRVTSLYDFNGRVTKSREIHSGIQSATVVNEFFYDHAGRPTQTWQTIGALGTRTLLSENRYNEAGQLIEKNTHSTDNGANFIQSIDYRYTIRGQLASINNSNLSNDGSLNNDSNDLFGLELKYNQGTTLNGTTIDPLFDGGISMAQWKTNNLRDIPAQRVFGYKYDFLSRLSSGIYAKSNGSAFTLDAGAFNELLTYDKNGNIKTLNRYSLLGTSGTPVAIDQLDFKYGNNSPNFDNKGNQLTYIDDGSSHWDATQGNPDLGFIENTKRANMGSTLEYTHDSNGNITIDYNKGITGSGGIQYNHLNKPTVIPMQGGGTITYTYDALGNKLRKVVQLGSQTARTDYLGPIHYQDSQIAFIFNSVGRAVKKGTNYNYEYFHRDHQGNTRLVYGYENETYDYKATLETERSTQENIDFKNISRSATQNRTPKSSETPTPQYSAALNGSVGPAKILTVANNDVVTMEAYAKYVDAVSGNVVTPATFATSVANAMFTAGEAGHTAIINNANLPTALTGLSANPGAPKAFIGYCLFSTNFSWSQFGFAKVSTAASGAHQKLALTLPISLPVGVSQAYMYIYVANQTTGTTVYFDDFSVVHEKTNNALQVVQSNDFYPFGLAISPLSYQKQLTDLPTNKNKYKFQKQERQEELGLGFDQYEYRMHDPAVGRFTGVDPLSDKYSYNSTYSFSENKVGNSIELEGLEAIPIPPYVPPVFPQPYTYPTTYTPPYPGYNPSISSGIITYSDWLSYMAMDYNFNYSWMNTTWLNYAVDYVKYDFPAVAPYRDLVLRIENEGWTEAIAAAVAVAITRPEIDGNMYENYITVRPFKMAAELANQPLVYTGYTTGDRYSASQMQGKYYEVIATNVEKGVSRGIEQIIIELNNGGMPYPYLSNTVDNFYNSTSPLRLEYYTRKLEGYQWLYTNIPGWQGLYHRSPLYINDYLEYFKNIMNTK